MRPFAHRVSSVPLGLHYKRQGEGTSSDGAGAGRAHRFLPMTLSRGSQASETRPDTDADTAPWASLPSPSPRPPNAVPLSSHLLNLPKFLKVSFRGNHQAPHPLLPEQERNWLGSFLLSLSPRTPLPQPPHPNIAQQLLPPSLAFMTRGNEHVPTSQKPASPTLTSRSWRRVCC